MEPKGNAVFFYMAECLVLDFGIQQVKKICRDCGGKYGEINNKIRWWIV